MERGRLGRSERLSGTGRRCERSPVSQRLGLCDKHSHGGFGCLFQKWPRWERLFSVLCFPVPEQPAFLKVVKVDKDAAMVAWGLPEKLNGNLAGFLLQYQTSAWELGRPPLACPCMRVGRGLALREPRGRGCRWATSQ